MLLESQVFVLGHTEAGSEGVKDVAAGESLSIQNWQKNDGTPVIPFFASLESVKPFYERASGSKLKSLFGFGRA